jgi:hypothetical protein
MAVNQLDTPVQGKHNPGFDFEGFGQLTLLVFLMLTYPLLGMLWHHQYPVFSFEIILLLFVFVFLASLFDYSNDGIDNGLLYRQSHRQEQECG